MQAQIRRILIPTDFSEPARQAQAYAIALAEKFGSELHLMHIVPEVVIPFPDASTSWTMPATFQKDQLKSAETRLLQQLDTQWAKNHVVIQTTKVGSPVEEIVSYAKETDIDLIVIGTHGYSGFAHFLLGSVAEKIVRMATCPVLTVHPKGHQFVAEV